MNLSDNQQTFLALLRAGLWEDSGSTESWNQGVTEAVDWGKVCQLAVEQSVQGLVLAGIERYKNLNFDLHLDQKQLLRWIGEVQMIEQQNLAMNRFVAQLIEKLRKEDIYALLVKGQGIAQCYEKPLWRPSGDVDLLLSDANYKKAKDFLLSLSSGNKHDERYSKHLGMNISQWYVEIHGSLRTGLSARVDKEVDAAQDSVFIGGNVRSWDNNGTLVFLPAPTEDVFLVFTHFIKHFYKEGMSLRQVCDWCRLLWTCRNEIKADWLEKHIRKAGLMKEWQMFAALAVEYLGMPAEAMPFININDNLNKKAEKLMEFILGGYSGNKIKDTLQIAKIFPWKALRYSPSIFLNVNWLKIRERLFN